jgi:ketosteroid isomerase-like protein
MTGEDEIRAADQAWLEAFAAGNLERSLQFCADDCEVMPQNAPAAKGLDAIRSLFREWFKPGLKIHWTPDRVEASGDLGFSSGTYEMSFEDSGRTVRHRGKYLIVWKKQPDGTWKVVRDISNSDLPAVTAQE